MRRARKGPRALGRLRKSLNATKRSLWKALLDAARRDKVPELWGGSGVVGLARTNFPVDAPLADMVLELTALSLACNSAPVLGAEMDPVTGRPALTVSLDLKVRMDVVALVEILASIANSQVEDKILLARLLGISTKGNKIPVSGDDVLPDSIPSSTSPTSSHIASASASQVDVANWPLALLRCARLLAILYKSFSVCCFR